VTAEAVTVRIPIGTMGTRKKWLKDHKGRELSFDDILHYQKIIVALSKAARL
jgi:hypothetical protein